MTAEKKGSSRAVLARCAQCLQFFSLGSGDVPRGLMPICPRCSHRMDSAIAFVGYKYGLDGNVSVRGDKIKTASGWEDIQPRRNTHAAR